MSAPHLSNRQVVVMRSLFQRGASIKAVSLQRWLREHAVPLWRRGLVEIWYRQSVDARPALDGPFYALTINGARLASMFFPAPRGSTGAEQR